MIENFVFVSSLGSFNTISGLKVWNRNLIIIKIISENFKLDILFLFAALNN